MSDTVPEVGDARGGADHLDPDAIDPDPAARSVIYQTLASAFDNPTDELHASLSDGRLEAGLRDALSKTALDVPVPDVTPAGDPQELSARYNRLFALGQTVVTDRTDGSVEREGPTVSLYASTHRDDATWEAVNADLARAYEYYGLAIDEQRREHHDNLRLELAFAGYLARREAVGEDDAARARRDFLDRHLQPFAVSLHDALVSVDGGCYANLAALLEAVVTADHEDLADRFGEPPDQDRTEVW